MVLPSPVVSTHAKTTPAIHSTCDTFHRLFLWERRSLQRYGGTHSIFWRFHTTDTLNYCLRQFCAASLVDAASVYPHPLISIRLRLLAGIEYFLIALATTDFILLLSIHLGKVDHLFIVNFGEVNLPM